MTGKGTNTDSSPVGWLKKQMDVRTVIFIIGGIGSMVVWGAFFWMKSHENFDITSKNTESIDALKVFKADKAEINERLKSMDEKINRQYQTQKEYETRFEAIEKELAHESGVREGEKNASPSSK